MSSVPVALILHLLREIRLNDTGKMMSLGPRNKAWSNPRDEQQHGHDGEQNTDPASFLAWERAVGPNKQSVEASHEERQAVDAGDGGQLHERGIFRRGVAEQSPGKTDLRQVGAQNFRGNPKERRAQKREGEIAAPQSLNHPGEEADRGSQTVAISSSTAHPAAVDMPP